MSYVLSILLILASVGLAVIAYCMSSERIKRYSLCGVRTKAALSSDGAWFYINKRCAPASGLIAFVFFVYSILFCIEGLYPNSALSVGLIITFVLTLVCAIAWVYVVEHRARVELNEMEAKGNVSGQRRP